MAVSGSKDFAVTRADIIEAALRKTGAYDQSDPVPGSETNAASNALNLMVKFLMTKGADIWLRDEITLFLTPSSQSYSLGTANAASTYVETTLSAAAASSATSLTVTNSTGMTAADNVGIKLDDNTIHWTTIVSVDSATAITITAGIASAAASGKNVYAFTTRAGRPQKIVYAFRRDKNGLDTPVEIVGENEYRQQSNKDSTGPPIQVWYHPTLTTGTLYVWPTDGGANWDKLIMIAQYVPDDFDTGANNPEFPIEWGEPLVYGLADRLAPEYGLTFRERQMLHAEAEDKLNDALDYDVENADVVFGMEVMGRA